MIDRKSLQQMRPDALLINVARGPVVVEADLVEALREGRLAGAGLDVTETEPLPPQSALWDLPNVLITPHVGAQSSRRIGDTTDLFCENLRRFREGRPLANLVDKRLGFPHPSSIWTSQRQTG
jgi:D-3-phosphoglycerate dehydrogenase